MGSKKQGFWSWYKGVHWGWKVLAIILIILAIVAVVLLVFVIVYAIVAALVYIFGGPLAEDVVDSVTRNQH